MARFVRFPGGGAAYTPEHFTFDGVSGTFLSTPDVNLLDADDAHIIQSQPWGPSRTTVVDNGVVASGWGSILVTVTEAASNPRAFTPMSVPVTAQLYSVSYLIENKTAHDQNTSVSFRHDVANVGGTSTIVPASTTMRVTSTATLQAGNLTEIWLSLLTDGNQLVGDEFVISEIMLSVGTPATFVPSLRIVGDIEMEAKASSPSSANQTLMATWGGSGSNGYQFGANLSGNLLARHGNGSVDRFASGSNLLTPGVFQTVKGGFDAAGNWSFDIDGVSETVGPTTPGAASPSGGLSVGSNAGGTINLFTGDISSAIVRDGIGGPTVASFLPDDYTGAAGAIPDGTTFIDSVTGRVWTANGNIVNVLAEFGNSIATSGLTVPSPVFIVKNPPAMPDIIDGDRWIIGNQWAGDGFTAQMHDGTDATGPIVAEFDAEDIGL